jgi:glycosyltransferase involved in cell wall biosynthesis
VERVTVISTVWNEAASIAALLDSLRRQSRPPDEVIIVDGGSRDGTWEALERYAASGVLPLRILSAPGCNISRGRNLAIAAASSPLIAATDAGVRLEEDWLAALLAPFAAPDPPEVVAGFFQPAPASLFERALGAVTLPLLAEVDPARFNPSSRSVAYRRAAWERVGGYPEWLDYCEDLLFDFGLRAAGCRFAFAPQALAHFRPRPTLRAFFKQYYRYARGDGKADFYRYRHALRYATYLGGAILLLLALLQHPLWLLPLAVGLAGMLHRPLRRAWPRLADLPGRQKLRALAWVPLIQLSGDIAKMAGYPVGVWWRWRRGPRGLTWAKEQW